MNPYLLAPALLAGSLLPTQSDERLTDLAQSGSEAAFEALVARYRGALVRHCTGILGEADAEEAVQEALVRAHAAMRRGDPVYRIRPWLHRIAHNTALNLLRARAAHAEPMPASACDWLAVEDGTLERRRQLTDLVAAVDSLPDRQREAIVMRELEGRSYAEIAERLGASQGAVRQLLNRARATVRRRLAAVLPWEPLSRWLPSGSGASPVVGSRVGALTDACGPAVKVCAALLPAAALGAGGVSVADHVAAVRSHPARSQSAWNDAPRRTPAVASTGTVTARMERTTSGRATAGAGISARATVTGTRSGTLRVTTHDVGRETGKYGRLFSQHPVSPSPAPAPQHRAPAKRETPATQPAQQHENAPATSPARPQSTPQPAVAATSTAAVTPAPTPNPTPVPTSATTNIVELQSDQREELDREDQSRTARGVRQAAAGD